MTETAAKPHYPGRDSAGSYGWISIVLHWLTAAAIGFLWFVGDSAAASETAAQRAEQVSLHVSVAIAVYAFFLLRIVWRFKSGHPDWEGQKRYDRLLSRAAQTVMLVCLLVMIASGPVILLGSNTAIRIFGFGPLPGGILENAELIRIAYRAHALAATLLVATAVLHIAGAFKHLMFDDDDIFLRMLVPKRRGREDVD